MNMHDVRVPSTAILNQQQHKKLNNLMMFLTFLIKVCELFLEIFAFLDIYTSTFIHLTSGSSCVDTNNVVHSWPRLSAGMDATSG